MKKRKLKRLSFIALMIGMLLIITGCQSSTPTAESLAGEYKSTIDMTTYINDGMSGMLGEDYELDFQFESRITSDINLVLNDDNTFSLELDYGTLKDSLGDAMEAEGIDFAKAILKALNVDQDEIPDGYEDELKEAVVDSFDEESLGDTGKVSGKYEINGTEITLTGDNSSMSATVDEDNLVVEGGLKDFTGEDADLVFKRVE